MIIPPNMENQKLTLRNCLRLIVFILCLLLGFWLVVKFDMCPFPVTGDSDKLENRSNHRWQSRFGDPTYKRFQFDNPSIMCYFIRKLPTIGKSTSFFGNYFDNYCDTNSPPAITRHRKTPEHTGDARIASHLRASACYRNTTCRRC